MRLFLVRHGQSEGNAAGIIQGHLDFGLTELGKAQARAAAARLAREKVDRIISSPLGRAMATANIIAGQLGLPVEPEPALLEYDIGEVSGLTGAEIGERYPEVRAAVRRGERAAFPGEEGRDVFYARVGAVLERWKEQDQRVLAIAHGGVISALCYIVLGIDWRRRGIFEVANCSITEFARDRAGRIVILRQNDTCHLRDLVTVVDRG